MNVRRSLDDWFLAAARRWPDAAALDLDGVVLSFAELRAVAERLAARIARSGPEVPSRVGICTERGLPMYAGYLAILRLGATVVPLSPRSPALRNLAVIRAAGVDAVLADEAGGAALRRGCAPRVLSLGALLAADRSAPGGVPPRHRGGPAYILFTSGSTGIPKGVPVSHSAVSAFLAHAIDRYKLGPGCRVSQTFDLTFDPSVLDLFATWGAGGTVVVPRKKELLIPSAYVRRRRLTHWFSVPSIVSMARRYRALPEGGMPGLRWSVFMGEPLTVEQAETWRQAAPGSAIENAFGPTELTVLCTGYRLPRRRADWPRTRNGTVPIGAVFPDLQAVVLDEDGYPATEGELCVRGPQRFDGYLDPADDLDRFLAFDGVRATAPPYGARPAAEHWYRTGDRVRLEAGLLVHAGRLDRQIKLRGQRVELGEVEAVLRGSGQVIDAVVVALKDANGDMALHAVVSGEPDGAHGLAEVAKAHLPDYMRPRSYTWIPEMPLNPNGKLDRTRVKAELLVAHGGEA